MNDEESNYDELRWLASDARKERKNTVRRTASWAVGSLLVTAFFVSNQQTPSDPPAVPPTADHTAIENELKEIKKAISDLSIGPVDPVDLSAIEDSLEALVKEVEILDDSRETREDILLQLKGLEEFVSSDVRVTLQIFADGLTRGIWRSYPMAQGDNLWIPDGEFYVRLDDRPTRDTVEMAVYLSGSVPPQNSPWTLQEAAPNPTTVRVPDQGFVNGRAYEIKLYYAKENSERPGFEGRDFTDVAICWTDLGNTANNNSIPCPDEVPAYLR